VATLAELMAARPLHRDVSVKAWDGLTVRVARLSRSEKMRIATLASDVQKSPDDKDAQYEFCTELLATSILDDEGRLMFADPSAREWLDGEIAAVAELAQVAIDLNGLGDSGGEVEEKKSN
jgi:hypothetical protein